MNTTRRAFLQGVGALGVASLVGLAGCSSVEADPEPTEPVLGTEPDYGDWFDGVNTYDRTLDWRDQSAATVTVGTKAGMGHFNFGPAAIAVSPGTTVTWEWSGKGGGHDVVALDGAFQAPLTDAAGATFAHTFDAPGIYKYFCTPHRGMGMKGAVVVLD